MPKKICLVIAFICFLVHMSMKAQEKLEELEINLPDKSWTIEFLLKFLEDKYQVMFSYAVDDIPLKTKVQISATSLKLPKLLEIMFTGTSIKYSFVANQVVLKKNKTKKNKFTIKGKVIDASTGENLIGASIYAPAFEAGSFSNAYGFYSITLPENNATLKVSFIGYYTESIEIDLHDNSTFDIRLKPLVTSLNEITIDGNRSLLNNVQNTQLGEHYISAKEIKAMPGLGGQPDVLRSLQFFPGIVPLNDGIALYSARGGGADQNLILLDEAPVYNPSHVLGFFSAFNPDATQSAEILKGHIPARFGGRLSSVADIRMKEGNRNKFSMAGFIDPLSAGLTVESPIKSENTSFLISGRYFNFTPLSMLAESLHEILYLPGMNNFDEKNKIHFYDTNFKLNHKLNNKNQLFLSAYTGRDGFYFAQIDDRSRQEWGNTTATIRWNHISGDKLFYNVTALYSRYNYAFNLHDGAYMYKWQADMNEGNVKIDYDYYPNTKHHLEFGGNFSYLNILPGKIVPTDTNSFASDFSMQRRNSAEIALYIGNTQQINNKLSINYGLRINTFIAFPIKAISSSVKPKEGIADISPEPRISICYLVKNNLSVKASYNRLSQPLHLLSNATVGMPTDIWIPANEFIRPQLADQYSFGLYSSFSKNRIESSVEVFYKSLYRIIDFVDNASLQLNEMVDFEILTGKGRAFGMEYLIRKSQGKLTGWLGYTLSKTERKIEGINNDQYYPSKYDHRHNISAFVAQSLGKRLLLSATFNYRTGNAITFPLGIFEFKGSEYYIYSTRNGYRLPDYHRLDFTVTFKNKVTKKHKSEWGFSMYNIYGRKNVFAYYNNKMMYLPGAVPIIRYSFTF